MNGVPRWSGSQDTDCQLTAWSSENDLQGQTSLCQNSGTVQPRTLILYIFTHLSEIYNATKYEKKLRWTWKFFWLNWRRMSLLGHSRFVSTNLVLSLLTSGHEGVFRNIVHGFICLSEAFLNSIMQKTISSSISFASMLRNLGWCYLILQKCRCDI